MNPDASIPAAIGCFSVSLAACSGSRSTAPATSAIA